MLQSTHAVTFSFGLPFMIGAIIGDVVGSHYEHFPTKSLDFDLFAEHSCFTDDTVLTVAVADWILHGVNCTSTFTTTFGDTLTQATAAHLSPGLAAAIRSLTNSWGNGSAMRVSPVAYAKDTLEEVLALAKVTADVTHNHPDGVAGARATAGSIFLARTGKSKAEIRDFVESGFGYDLSRRIENIRPQYSFDVSCAGSVPESIIAFLESDSYESAIRLAISLGGDSDTMACIAGSIAEAFYGEVPAKLELKMRSYLDGRLLKVVDKFRAKFC